MKSRSLWILLAAAMACLHATQAAALDADRIVVLISLDGLAGFYLDDPKAEMPTLRQLAAEGARSGMMKASNPTVTWPNHTTLVTGVTPARHGVVGNNYWDRATGRKVTLIWDPALDKGEIVKVPTIYDLAKAEGYKTAAVRWPATRNASGLDWNSPDVGKDSLTIKYTTPALIEDCKEAGISITRGGADDGEAANKAKAYDEIWTNVFNLILEKHRPNLAMLHLVNIDHTEHLEGPQTPEAYAAIKVADGQVREVWETVKELYGDKATIIIVSDHGFSPIERQILPNVILRKAGLVETSGDRITDGAVQIIVQGGSVLIYVAEEADRADTIARVKKAFEGVQGISRVVSSDEFASLGVADPRRDPHAPDVIVFSEMGHNFGDTAAGTLPFVDKPERKGSHGHDADLPKLYATFVAWGHGIKPGPDLGEIKNIDVAPTIARLLSFSMPDVDGKPLEAVLAE